MPNDIASAIAACLAGDGSPALDELEQLVRAVLDGAKEPSRMELEQLQQRITAALPGGRDRVALVYGGPTKIKDYVFEAPKLPEIRGASALLDWVNNQVLRDLWQERVGVALASRLGGDERAGAWMAADCVIYAGGGSFLGVAPAGMGAALADAMELTFTAWTLTANSVAVAEEVGLLSLRYGRDPLAYWVEDFIASWPVDRPTEHLSPAERRCRDALDSYYPTPDNVAPDDNSEDALRARFFKRKTFGELVGLLATKFYRRREERGYARQERLPRDVPSFPLIPWAARCDSSDVRPAVWQGTVGAEAEPRELSEASARKRYVGQLVKKDDPAARRWFEANFDWRVDKEMRSWEQAWEQYLRDHPDTGYAREITRLGLDRVRPAHDVHQIGAPARRYIGMIYADGNNIGRLLAGQRTIDDYRLTSTKLSVATMEAVFAALAEHLVPQHMPTGRDAWIHPFEILTIGGDDLLLIVPGTRALDIALSLGLHFEERLNPPASLEAISAYVLRDRYVGEQSERARQFFAYEPQIGLSAGVVIAQENAPIFFLRDLADELLESAKRAGRERRIGMVDFMVMKSITMVTDKIAGFRKVALGDEDDPDRPRLTGRPYTWHEFAGLVETTRALRSAGMPRSQLYRLRRVLADSRDSGILAGSLEYLTTRVRLRRELAGVVLDHVERNWRGLGSAENGVGSGAPPWLRRGHGWETIWPDLVEIYDVLK